MAEYEYNFLQPRIYCPWQFCLFVMRYNCVIHSLQRWCWSWQLDKTGEMVKSVFTFVFLFLLMQHQLKQICEGCFSPVYLYRWVLYRWIWLYKANLHLFQNLSWWKKQNYAYNHYRHRASFGKECKKMLREEMDRGNCECPM